MPVDSGIISRLTFLSYHLCRASDYGENFLGYLVVISTSLSNVYENTKHLFHPATNLLHFHAFDSGGDSVRCLTQQPVSKYAMQNSRYSKISLVIDDYTFPMPNLRLTVCPTILWLFQSATMLIISHTLPLSVRCRPPRPSMTKTLNIPAVPGCSKLLHVRWCEPHDGVPPEVSQT